MFISPPPRQVNKFQRPGVSVISGTHSKLGLCFLLYNHVSSKLSQSHIMLPEQIAFFYVTLFSYTLSPNFKQIRFYNIKNCT